MRTRCSVPMRFMFALLVVPMLSACFPESPDSSTPYQYEYDGPINIGPVERRDIWLKPARPQSLIASHLRTCIVVYNENCTLSDVPMIGMRDPHPDVEIIMEHVISEKQWMADRFQQILESLPPQFLLLFRSTTGVVIGSHIRPSHYWGATGAIYIDPSYLWMSKSEFEDTPQFPDYRSYLGSELQFRTFWRYVKNGGRAFRSFLSYYPGRTFEDVYNATGRLLAHELAHAADAIPPAFALSTSPRERFVDVYISLNPREFVACPTWPCIYVWVGYTADALRQSFPLSSELLFETARIFNRVGWGTSDQMKAVTPDDIGAEFQTDGGSDDYNYHTPNEDVAMLFEELTAYHFFGMQRDFAVVDRPDGENLTGNDYTVYWGQRGRVADPLVIDRALFVAGRLLPELDLASVRRNLPPPVSMVRGRSWEENLALNADGKLDSEQLKGMRVMRDPNIELDSLSPGELGL